MSDIAEGIGAAIEGSLAARAVEPRAGESATGHADETHCANCGAPLTGPYCNQCGQKAHVHRTLSAIGHDLMHGVLHLDGKLAHTLPLLVLKPGTLTRRYIEGERAKFVSPMAMFLFSVFAMFAVFQVVGISAPSDFELEADLNRATETMRSEAEEAREERLKDLEELPADAPERAELEAEVAQLDESLAGLKEVTKLTFNTDNPKLMDPTGVSFLDKLSAKWEKNPGLMIYKLQANAYKFSWLLIPLSIPFVWLIFAWKRRFKAYDHAVFVTYSLSFMSLLFIAISSLGVAGLPVPIIVFSALLIPPIHLYKHLRRTYELGRFSAFWRLLVLSVFIWIVAILFLQALLLLGAF
ncbi:MAG: DUF3667 domain-containing protein [Pseudomonadota bacterium]